MDVLGYPIFLLMSAYVGQAFEGAMNNAYINSVALVASVGSVIMAIWVSFYGIRMAYGTQGYSMSDFLWRAGKATLIFAIIAASTTENLSIQNMITGLRDDLVQVITNSHSSYKSQINTDLTTINLLQSAPALFLNEDNSQDQKSTLNIVLTMVGQGSPAIIGGIMLLLNELAVRIGIAVGPLMLFSLLFEGYKDLFSAWVRLLAASIISMALLAVVVGHAAVLMGIFVAVLSAAKALDVNGTIFTELQVAAANAGFGLILSVLIYSVPNMAARYFGGGMYVSPSNLFSGLSSSSSSEILSRTKVPINQPPGTTGNL
jgi:type IV secretion system protein VirB6